MLARINRYMEKQIARDTWDDVAWYIGGYMYMTLGKWLDSMFILYSAVPYALLLLGYNIYLTVLFCRKGKESPLTGKMVWRLCWRYLLSMLLIACAFITLSEANAHAAALNH